MTVLNSNFVTFFDNNAKLPSKAYFEKDVILTNGITLMIYDNDPYYTVFFLKDGNVFARQGMVYDLDSFIQEAKTLNDKGLLGKPDAV